MSRQHAQSLDDSAPSRLAARRTAHLWYGSAQALRSARRADDDRLLQLVAAHPEQVLLQDGRTLAEHNSAAAPSARLSPAEALERLDAPALLLAVMDSRVSRAEAAHARRAHRLWQLACLLAPLLFALLLVLAAAEPAHAGALTSPEGEAEPPPILEALTTCVLTAAPPAPALADAGAC